MLQDRDGTDELQSRPGAGLGPRRSGRVRPMILMWALGVPIPIILIIMLMRGCF